MADVEQKVREILAANGFPAGEDEIRRFAELYPALRAIPAALDAIPGLADEAPELTFDPRG